MEIPIVEWKLESETDGACDKILTDTGSGFGSEYSKIHELSASKLDVEATDGSYYGTRTRYDRHDGSGPPEQDTCQGYCESSADCAGDQVCLQTGLGWMCLPGGCQNCFIDGESCDIYLEDCSFHWCFNPNEP